MYVTDISPNISPPTKFQNFLNRAGKELQNDTLIVDIGQKLTE